MIIVFRKFDKNLNFVKKNGKTQFIKILMTIPLTLDIIQQLIIKTRSRSLVPEKLKQNSNIPKKLEIANNLKKLLKIVILKS